MAFTGKRPPKELFMVYRGSHYLMAREGDYDEYLSYAVTKDQEEIWLDEYRRNLITEFQTDQNNGTPVSSYCQTITLPKDDEKLHSIVREIIAGENRMDSFTRLHCAEALLQTVGTTPGKTITVESAIALAQSLLLNVINSPVTMAKPYRNFDYLNDKLASEKLIVRAQKNLRASKVIRYKAKLPLPKDNGTSMR